MNQISILILILKLLKIIWFILAMKFSFMSLKPYVRICLLKKSQEYLLLTNGLLIKSIMLLILNVNYWKILILIINHSFLMQKRKDFQTNNYLFILTKKNLKFVKSEPIMVFFLELNRLIPLLLNGLHKQIICI